MKGSVVYTTTWGGRGGTQPRRKESSTTTTERPAGGVHFLGQGKKEEGRTFLLQGVSHLRREKGDGSERKGHF